MNPYKEAERREKLEADLLDVALRDWQMYIAEHATIFGHVPQPDLLKRVYCTHPLHGYIERDISADGVETALRHERVSPHTVMSIDDPEIDPSFGSREYEEAAGRPWDTDDRVFEGDDR
jgi:hypothetical protein